jgi:hypothetical protein
MVRTMKLRASINSMSAFVVPTEPRRPGSDVWAEDGSAIEQAYRAPAPMSHTVRIAVALALAAAAKLCVGGVL